MEKELKDKWVAALRSGEYRQGKYELYDRDESFCCLGVLCAVAGIGIDASGNSCVGVKKGGSGYDPIRDLIGREAVPVLMEMNDNEGKTFPEIADYIEANL